MGRRPKQTFLWRRYTDGQCLCAYSVAKSSQILCDPMNCSPQAPLSVGFSRQKYWSGLPFLSPGDLSSPDPHLLHWQVNSLPLSHLGSQLLEKCKSKLEWGSTSHWSEWPSLKSLQIINVEEDVEKWEHFYTVGENENWYSHYGKHYRGSSKN